MCLAEVPFFCLSGSLIRLMGVRGVIALAQLAYLTRFVYYSVRFVFLRCGGATLYPFALPLFRESVKEPATANVAIFEVRVLPWQEEQRPSKACV